MATSDAFGPHSLFGVPLQPFAPGCCWKTSLEMVEEVFEDFQIRWVQDFMLRSHLKQDAYALNDPSNYSRSISCMQEGTTIPQLSGGYESTVRSVLLDVPVLSIDHIGVGVGVKYLETNSGMNCRKESRVFRTVYNDEKHSQLHLKFQEDIETISVIHMKYSKTGIWQGAILKFSLMPFLSAFNDTTFRMNLQRIDHSLLLSMTVLIPRRQIPPIITNRFFPHKVAYNNGEHMHCDVLTSYANAVPMMSISVFALVSWTNNYDASKLRRMQNWGISDRLQRTTMQSPGRNLNISFAYLNTDVEQVTTNPPNTAGNSIREVSIVPRPTSAISQVLSEQAEDERNARKEIRKIRKREAAARSYRRKIERSKNKN